MSVYKDEIIKVIEDIKEHINEWDWDEDYHGSGLENREDRIEWSRERLRVAIDIIEDSGFIENSSVRPVCLKENNSDDHMWRKEDILNADFAPNVMGGKDFDFSEIKEFKISKK